MYQWFDSIFTTHVEKYINKLLQKLLELLHNRLRFFQEKLFMLHNCRILPGGLCKRYTIMIRIWQVISKPDCFSVYTARMHEWFSNPLIYQHFSALIKSADLRLNNFATGTSQNNASNESLMGQWYSNAVSVSDQSMYSRYREGSVVEGETQIICAVQSGSITQKKGLNYLPGTMQKLNS